MKAEIPALGILKTGDFGDSKFYKVTCSCGQPNHDIDFEVEAADTGINVNTYVTVKTDYWSEAVQKRYDLPDWAQEFDWAVKDIINGLWIRLKLTWTLWTKGYVQTETTISMSEQQALNYAETLKSAIKDVKELSKPKENSAAVKAANEQDCV